MPGIFLQAFRNFAGGGHRFVAFPYPLPRFIHQDRNHRNADIRFFAVQAVCVRPELIIEIGLEAERQRLFSGSHRPVIRIRNTAVRDMFRDADRQAAEVPVALFQIPADIVIRRIMPADRRRLGVAETVIGVYRVENGGNFAWRQGQLIMTAAVDNKFIIPIIINNGTDSRSLSVK